jgi:exodeoxyribonuclease VII large subunit
MNALLTMKSNISSPDILIVGRGGGSLEDLMAFNEEIVVRAIYNSKIPIISAVGHEVDNSLSDYVADVRSPTPTAAAEIALPERKTLKNNLDLITSNISFSINTKLNLLYEKYEKSNLPHSHNIIEHKAQNLDINFDHLSYKIRAFMDLYKNNININKIELYSPAKYCANQLINLSSEVKLLKSTYKNFINKKINAFIKTPKILDEKIEKLINSMQISFIKTSGAIEALSYNRILERGFSLIKNEDGLSIKRAKDIVKDTKAIIHFYDGKINAKLSNDDNKK